MEMSDKEVIESNDDREMMRRSHLWSHRMRFGWGLCPVLPLKHRTEIRDGWSRLALWIDISSWGGACRWALKRDGMLLTKIEPHECEYGNDELIDRVIIEGWIVD
jgi:hypothetical protein